MGTRARYLVCVVLVVLALVVSGCKGRKAIPDLPAEEEMLLLEAEGNSTALAPATATATVADGTLPPSSEGAAESATTTQTEESTQPTATEASSAGEAATPQVEATVESSIAATPAVSSTGAKIHVVQVGQNLFRIALMYGTSVEAIAAANNITNPAILSVGQELQIPSATSAPAETPGDNLFRIAMRYGVDQYYLARYNGIDNPAMIYVGQVIRIP